MLQGIINFLIGPALTWMPVVILWLVFVAAVYLYLHRNKSERINNLTTYEFLIIFAITFKVLYALLSSVAQYYVWSVSALSKALLDTPLSENVPPSIVTELFPSIFAGNQGYFFFYAYGRFFINLFLALGLAFAFWAFLRLLRKHKDRFFEEGETELGLLCALIVGWPNFLVFIPVVFVSIVVISITRGIFLKEAYTTMGLPFLLAAFICLIAGDWLIRVLNLGVFRI